MQEKPYIVMSGPQDGWTTFEGIFASQDEAMVLIEKLEDNGSFCWLIDGGGKLCLVYATEY